MSLLPPVLANIKASIQRLVQRRIFSEPTVDGNVTTLRAGAEYCEHRQDFGFISIPPVGKGEGILIYPSSTRGKGVMIMADSKEHRPEEFEPGECGIFNSNGVVIKLSGKTVTITGADEILLGENGKALVTEDALDALKVHTHPVAGAAASASLDPAMATLDTNKTTITKGA